MHNTKILYISCAKNGLFGLRKLVASGHVISAVVTLPPELGERYNVAGYCDFEPYCLDHDIPMISLDSYTLRADHLKGVVFDLIIVNGWNRLISNDVISMAKMGGLGVHAGHPPIGLGRAPLVWNILLGRSDIEVYVFKLTPNADDGDIVASKVVEITPFDTVRLLYEKVMLSAADLFERAIENLLLNLPSVKQDLSIAVHYAKRGPEDGEIDFSKSEEEIYNFVRAQVPPYPGAFTWLEGQKWTVFQAIPFDRFAFRGIARRPGTVLCVLPSGVVVQTGGAPIWITSVQIDGEAIRSSEFEVFNAIEGKRFVSCLQQQSST